MPPLQHLDIATLPAAEDDRFEYKSSKTPVNALKDKLARAASGFWNSGGGIFVAGVDDQGIPDGGVAETISRTSIRDWIDQVLKEVAPVGSYAVRLFPHDPAARLNIAAKQCVAAVKFEESSRPPHMAPDRKYYIRAGAHTVPATHYIVEALWARRSVQRPQLAHTMRPKDEASDIIQLVVLALTEQPALNVTLSLDPLPAMWKDAKVGFPLKLPVLDRTTPFHLDVTTFFAAEERLGKGVRLHVEYEDLAKNCYSYTATLDLRAIAPWKIGTPASERTAKSFESIDKTLQRIPTALDKLSAENAEIRSRLEALKRAAFPQRATYPYAVAAQLCADAIKLLRAAKSNGTIIFSPYLGGSQLSAGDTQLIVSQSDDREVAAWKAVLSELRDRDLLDGLFARGGSSVFRLTDLGYRVADAIKEEPAEESEVAQDGD